MKRADTANAILSARLTGARPQVMAALMRRFRDVDLAEDCFQEACASALKTWPERGTPERPTAWLVRTGYNAAIDSLRHKKRIDDTPVEDVLDSVAGEDNHDIADLLDDGQYKDDVLRLMFMCCHEDLSVQDQLALALKVVVGFSVAEIARAFVVAPKTMEQRITRAKKRAAEIGAAIETPSPQERRVRLQAVTRMIYLLFNEGYAAADGHEHIRLSLCDEAIRLSRLLLELYPSQPKVIGLLALLLLQHSRFDARLDDEGRLLTLAEQDRTLWNREAIDEGRVLLERALRKGQPDSLQVQAAIAAVHCAASTAGDTDWAEITRLYLALEAFEPTPVVRLNHAIALAHVKGAEAGLEMLAPLSETLKAYRPYHAARAHLLEESGDFAGARTAYLEGLACAGSEAEKAYISERVRLLENKIH